MIIPAKPILAIVHLAIDRPEILRQVIISPDKVVEKAGIIRIGEFPADEAHGWMRLGDVEIMHVLGEAVEQKDGSWHCVPDGFT